MKYVAGFLFNDEGTQVALIEKKKWPKGCDWSERPLNAIGGKVEADESPCGAMKREFLEEAGVAIESWDEFARLKGLDWTVHFYRRFSTKFLGLVKTQEEEQVVISPTNFTEDMRPNLSWLIPLALDKEVFGVTEVLSK